MTLIAILGATGHIGRALAHHYAGRPDVELELYSRRPDASRHFSGEDPHDARVRHLSLDDLDGCRPDILVNAIGIGDPAKARQAGPAFYDLTMEIEDRIDRIAYHHRSCLTVFMSSGAIYGRFDDGPADDDTPASLPINSLEPGDWYAAAKLAAEMRHRAQPDRRILDIRVFGFVSPFLNLSTEYLVCDVVNSIKGGTVMRTNPGDITRDYVGAPELASIIDAGARHRAINLAVDTYSREPVSKFALLESLRRFGLEWHVDSDQSALTRSHYWSRYRGAGKIDYTPERRSIDIVGEVVAELVRLR